MRKLLFYLLAFFYAGNIYAQSGWFDQYSGVTKTLRAVDFANANTGVIVGDDGTILRTTNRGDNWILFPSITQDQLIKIEFLNNATGYILPAGVTHIYKSTNSGLNWFSIQTPYQTKTHMCFVHADTGYIMGTDSIMKTVNGGLSWKQFAYPTLPPSGMVFWNNTTGIVLVDTTMVYKTTNGGNNWFFIMNNFSGNTPSKLLGFGRGAPNSAAVWSSSTACYGTRDQAQSWNYRSFFHLEAVSFINPDTGLLAFLDATDGVIVKTTNGGATYGWGYWPSPNIQFYGVELINSTDAYAVGAGGKIKASRTGGIISVEPISTEVPANFFLSQNYPNPFNPSTQIKFSVKKAASVKIILYDVLGKEVATLVNENLNAGSYTVMWDGSGAPGGIYFYRMEAAGFTATKKMLLVK
jgi:photosystem II stability/assembly factor-like uncharacterized protein